MSEVEHCQMALACAFWERLELFLFVFGLDLGDLGNLYNTAFA